MRETLKRTEITKFTCVCGQTETITSDGCPDVPLGWTQLITHDAWVSIEGKTSHLEIDIQACTQACLFRAIEDCIDNALGSNDP